MAQVAEEVARGVRQAADALEQAAARVPDCDCTHLDSERMSGVVSDLLRAELASAAVHKCLKSLELQHCGGSPGLATLETQPLHGLPANPVTPRAPVEINIHKLAEEAGSEVTGGQCC